MSYNDTLKKELTSNKYSDKEIKEIIFVILSSNGQINIHNNKINLFLTSFHPDLIKFLYLNLKKLFKKEAIISSKNKNIFGVIKREYKIEIFDCDDLYKNIQNFASSSFFCSCVGLFLTCGNISSPNSPNYNLYITLTSKDISKNFLNINTLKREFIFKEAIYKNKYILHIKKAESIANFLRFINCYTCLFEYEDTRIERDLVNNVNRLNNLDISNQKKIIEASKKHNKDIKLILKDSRVKLYFKDEDIIILKLKLSYPDFSLKELTEKYNSLYSKKISKSKINYLLQKVKKIIDKK